MLRRYQSLLGKLYAMLDSLAVIIALLIAWLFRFRTPLPQFHALPFLAYMSIMVYAVPAFVAGAALFGLYGTTRNSSRRVLSSQLVKAAFFMVLVIMSVLFFNKQVHYSRTFLIFFVLLSWGISLLFRSILQQMLRVARRRGLNRKYLVFAGATKATGHFLEHIHQHPEFGFAALGYLAVTETPSSDMPAGAAAAYEGVAQGGRAEHASLWDSAGESALAVRASSPVQEEPAPGGLPAGGELAHPALGELACLGTIHELGRILSENIVDHLVLTVPPEESHWLPKLLRIAESHGVHAIFVPDFLGILPSRPRIEEFAGLPIIDPDYTPLDEAVNVMFKRAFDIVFSLCVLVLGSPILLLIALAVRWSSHGPVVYSQVRLGKNRRPFKMYKFRTMRQENVAADKSSRRVTASEVAASAVFEDNEGWTVVADPRRTPVGRFLRSMSLDELPQFWNVLRGDMSVIGPRPERPKFVEQFRGDIPMYMLKHRVRPGITGWAQVNGLRGDTSIEERIQYDLRYIEEWSFVWDLRIVLLTIAKGFRNKNAY